MKNSITDSTKKITRTLVVTALLVASAQAAYAGLTVTTAKDFGPYNYGSGGEFTLIQGGGLNVAGNYSNKTGNTTFGTFQSFCLEKNEYLDASTKYNVVLNNAADKGGNGGGTPDRISQGTAWLYLNFAKGTLQNYDYTDVTKRQISAGLLQETIWYLENEQGTLANDTYLQLAKNALHMSNTNDLKADYTGSTVKVLNLTDSCGIKKQDQLVVTPIPAAAWLFGSGILGLVGIKRRKTANAD